MRLTLGQDKGRVKDRHNQRLRQVPAFSRFSFMVNILLRGGYAFCLLPRSLCLREAHSYVKRFLS
jgi:hypothetical protein